MADPRSIPSPSEAWAAMVESSAEAMVAIDPNGTITFWNGGAEALFGYSRDEVLGRPISILDSSEERGDGPELLERLGNGERIVGRIATRRRRDGLDVPVAVTMVPLRDGGGRFTGAALVVGPMASADDLGQTERLRARELALRDALAALRRSHEDLKATQLQLVQSAKLESVGRLAASVAHEVKNPLAIILAALEYLIHNVDSSNDDLRAALDDIRRAVGRADAIVGGLLNYAAATELTPSVADINRVIEQALLLVKHALTREGVHLERELGTDLPRVNVDQAKLEQVFVNLFINAVDAMPSGGTLRVRTSRRQLRETGPEVGYRRTDAFRVGQTVVVIEVEDTGTGIPADDLHRIFDPFFTTKPPGKGTGLGLAVSKTIIALHGGMLNVENKAGGGARATVVLQSVSAQGGT